MREDYPAEKADDISPTDHEVTTEIWHFAADLDVWIQSCHVCEGADGESCYILSNSASGLIVDIPCGSVAVRYPLAAHHRKK